MTKVKFFICKHCGNLVGMIENSGVPMVCCGEKMTELVPNVSDGAFEKHVPVATLSKLNDDSNILLVRVGSAEHPMTNEHYIKWIYVQTDKGGHRINLTPNERPEITLNLQDENWIAVYAYCNLHGLWKLDNN